jgi:hypothetical protein
VRLQILRIKHAGLALVLLGDAAYRTAALLDDVRQLMSQEAIAFGPARSILTLAKHDMRTYRVRTRVHRSG